MDPIMIILGPPVWVWPLLILLLWLGIRASRDRTTHVATIYWLPFLGFLSFFAVKRMGAPDYIWLCFGSAMAAGIALGFWLQRRWIVDGQGAHVSLRGEWLTLTMMMVVFWSNFVSGTVRAIAPDVYSSLPFVVAFASVVGLVSGLFGGRAIRVFVVTHRARSIESAGLAGTGRNL